MIRNYFLPAVITAAFIFFSCTSLSDAPEWVTEPPADTDELLWFYGMGFSAEEDQASASSEAANLIVFKITKSMGLSLNSNTTDSARDQYDKFKYNLASSILGKTSSGVKGLVVYDKWTEKTGDGINVHILAQYRGEDFQIEKIRLNELFDEKKGSVSASEKEGDELYEKSKFYHASAKYIEAALLAVDYNLEKAELKFERNITKAQNAIEQIEIENVSGPESVYLGEGFNSDFRVKLSARGVPAAGLPVTAIYKELGANGRKTSKTKTVLTDSEGIAYFAPPKAEWVGREKIVFFLDMRAVIKPLEDVSFELLQYVDGLEQAVNSRRTSFYYDILSKSVEVPTCIMVMDVDRSGNPLDKTDTASGIFSELSSSGFDVFILPVDYRMTAVSDSELIELVRERYGNIYKRFIFGTSEISSFDENSSSVVVKVNGRIKAVELDSGKILFSSSEQKRAMGSSNSATISAAFSSLGRMYGSKLVMELP